MLLSALLTSWLPKPPLGFKVVVPSKDTTYAETQMYVVSTKNGKLVVQSEAHRAEKLARNLKSKSARKPILKTFESGFRQYFTPGDGIPYANGELFFADVGEWGGSLTFLPRGSRKPEVVMLDNVKAITIMGSRIIELSDQSFMDEGGTYIREIIRQSDKWRIKAISTPPFAPNVAVGVADGFLVTTRKLSSDMPSPVQGVYHLSIQGKYRLIAKFDLSSHRVESIARTADNVIWLGGLHFVAALLPAAGGGYSTTFYIPK